MQTNNVSPNDANTHGSQSATGQSPGSSGAGATAGKLPQPPTQEDSPYTQPVVLQQSPFWSRGIMWGIMGVTAGVVTWAAFARIDEAVPALGQLEAQGSTQEVKVPVGGVVQEVMIKNGQNVKKGDLLLRLDPAAAAAQQASLQKTRVNLLQENALYRSLLQDQPAQAQVANSLAKIKPELASLASSRVALESENRLFRAQLNPSSGGLTAGQQERLRSSQSELSSRKAVAELEVSQLREQFQQAQSQLASAQDILKINEGILKDIEPLAKEGALSRVQYLQQVQTVRNQQAEVQRLAKEKQRLSLAVVQAQQKLGNTLAVSRNDILTKMAANEQRIAEIDSQLSKIIVENQRRINEIDSQLTQSKQLLTYQEVRSPVDGTIFDLKAGTAGYVANTSEPLLKVVPTQNLRAKVYIRNQDIGFVKEGMQADVRVDSFPFSEFGDVKGVVTLIGKDALAPTPERQYVSFPAEIRLERQEMNVRGQQIKLQSGMSVSTNLRVRDRSVLSLFVDTFRNSVEPLTNVR